VANVKIRPFILLGVGLSLVGAALVDPPPLSHAPAALAAPVPGEAVHFLKSPITQAGNIPPGGSQPFTLAVSANGRPVAGATVYIRYGLGSRLSNAVTSLPAGCNMNVLPQSGQYATCQTGANGQVTMTYTMPSPLPAQGSQEFVANLGPGTNDAITHYVSAAVYFFDHSPLAASGSLTPGQVVSSNLDIENGSLAAMPGGTAFLSFKGAPGGGTASAEGTQLTSTPKEFVADGSGHIPLTYTAPAALPNSGLDQIVVQDLANNPNETNSTSYSFAAGTPVISIGDVSVAEAFTSPTVPAKFTVTMTPTQPNPVTFTYTNECGIGDKWCSEDIKVLTVPQPVTIPAGQSSVTVTTQIYSYGGHNGGEHYNEGWFIVIAGAPSGTQIGKSVGTGIQLEAANGESLLVGDAASPATSDPSGTTLYFTVTSTTTTNAPLSFSYATANGTATAGTDYFPTQGVATIPAGSNNVIIPVKLMPEVGLAASRQFQLVISGAPAGVPISRGTGTGTIQPRGY
jgi:hypothetical protein